VRNTGHKTFTLENSEKRLSLLSEIVSQKTPDKAAQLFNALKATTELLDMEIGIISRIDNDDYEVIHYFPHDSELESGQIFELGNTYCSITLSKDDVYSIPYMKESEHHTHPCYGMFQLESYIGAPLHVDGERFGTINFSSSRPRTEAFEEEDHLLIKLLSDWAGGIIHRKQINEQLKREKEIYKLITTNSSELICLHGTDGTYRFVSESVKSLLGYEPEEMIGKSPYNFFHKDDQQRIMDDSHRQAKEGNAVITTEYRMRRKDGTYIWLDTATEPILDDEGEVTGLQTTSRNVTSRIKNLKKIQEQNLKLEQEKQTKEKLYSILAHDLRNSMYGISSLLDLVIEEVEDGDFTIEEVLEKLKLVQGSSIDSIKLLENIQNWVKIQTESFKVNPQLFDLSLQLQLTTNLFRPALKIKDIDLNTDFEKNIKVYGDSGMITTILRNLVNNAIKYSYSGSTIDISITQNESNGTVSVSVEDHGVGMSNEVLNQLFDRSNRPQRAGTNNEQGTGLGLLLVKELTELNKGILIVKSKENQGTKIILTLPSGKESNLNSIIRTQSHF
jgi:PAS domain S-box-containing protein